MDSVKLARLVAEVNFNPFKEHFIDPDCDHLSWHLSLFYLYPESLLLHLPIECKHMMLYHDSYSARRQFVFAVQSETNPAGNAA